MTQVGVVGLVLAAGASTRMGSELNKLTAIVQGKPLVAAPVDAMAEAGIAPVFVVVGHDSGAVRAALSDRDCQFIEHPGSAAGMGTSIAAGVRGLLDEVDPTGILISVGDLAGLKPEWIVELRRVFETVASPDAICVPTWKGRSGHPVLFGPGHFDALRLLEGDEGAKGILEGNAERVERVEIGSEAILRDIDTPADLSAWRS